MVRLVVVQWCCGSPARPGGGAVVRLVRKKARGGLARRGRGSPVDV